jgi:hypothetical protein
VVAWVALTATAAALAGSDTFVARLGAGVCGTVATVAFAFAGGATIVDRLRKREWRRRTSFVAKDLVRLSLEGMAELIGTTLGVVDSAKCESEIVSVSLQGSFALPLPAESDELWRDAAAYLVRVQSTFEETQQKWSGVVLREMGETRQRRRTGEEPPVADDGALEEIDLAIHRMLERAAASLEVVGILSKDLRNTLAEVTEYADDEVAFPLWDFRTSVRMAAAEFVRRATPTIGPAVPDGFTLTERHQALGRASAAVAVVSSVAHLLHAAHSAVELLDVVHADIQESLPEHLRSPLLAMTEFSFARELADSGVAPAARSGHRLTD